MNHTDTIPYTLSGVFSPEIEDPKTAAFEIRDKCREQASGEATVTFNVDRPATYSIAGDLCIDDFEAFCDLADFMDEVECCTMSYGDRATWKLSIPESLRATVEMLSSYLEEQEPE